ncbi:MAG: phage portal protein [Holosporaceae bacterium]|jgi:lambda family phage portal protein|nr:phage portal protein [Holosporaceae bacterium]
MNLFKSIANIFRKKASTPYDGAGHGKRLGNWYPTSSSINALLASSLSTLRTRSHDIVRKNPYAANAVDSIVSNCIGTGIKPQSKAKNSEFRKKIQELWLYWTDEADAAGLCDFYGLQALVLRSVIECGECFVRMKIDKKIATVPLKLQILESEHLDSSKDQMLPNGNVIRSGIEFDKTGKRVAYYLYREHPGENSPLCGLNIDSVRIPASEILHIFKPLRPGQIRGEPWLSNVLLKLHELDQYEDAELVRKKTAAMFAGFVTRLDSESEMFGEGNANNNGTAFAGLEPGTMQFLDPGEDVKFSSPADVGGTYEAFIKQQLRATAVGLGISYEMLTGDLSSVNYSSIRAGLVEFRRKCASLQHNLMVFQFCRPVWNRWIELAILSDAVEVPNDPTFSLVKWIPPGFAWVDPQKEVISQLNAVKAGFKSRTEVISEFGYDIEEIDDEIRKERQREKEMGLVFDSNPQHEMEKDDTEIIE